MPFQASVETWTASGIHHLAGVSRQQRRRAPTITLYLTFAGWGHFCLRGEEPHQIDPGRGFLDSTEWPGVSHYLPKDSPGWTFARIEIYHPYLQFRLSEQVNGIRHVIDLRPDEPLTASVLRLVRAEILRDFQDQFEAERALFDFVLDLERWTRRRVSGNREAQVLMEDARSFILANLPRATEVGTLAAKFGMSRCHFSHYFRRLTGISPAHFATEVRLQRVEAMLLNTREPLKRIADACGFANGNHLCKVFRRFRHTTPTAFRQAAR
jgi:AraC-like DNA-binding protein